ncbi:MAG: alpha/beta hydrolase [Chloroflexota bacterium]
MANWKINRCFKSSGGEIAYDQFGQGPPLVLVHGTPFSSYVWRNIVPALANNWTVYVYDLLGYGHSEKYEGQDVSLAAQTRVLVELLDHWQLDRPAVVGHDFGGATVLRTHLLAGRPLGSMALVDAVALAPWGSPFVQHVKQHRAAFDGLPAYIHRAIVAAYIRDAVYRRLEDEEVMPYVEPWLDAAGQPAFYRQIAQMDQRYTDEIEPLYGTIKRPVLLLWGANDGWIPPAKGRQLHKYIPHSELHLIPNASHLVQEDAPELVTRHLIRFFRENTA